MAILFQDDYLRCPKCHSAYLMKETVKYYKTDKKNPPSYISEPAETRLRCADCGEVVLRSKAVGGVEIY